MEIKEPREKTNFLENLRKIVRKNGMICARVTDLDTLAIEIPGTQNIYSLKILAAPPSFDWDIESRKYEEMVGDTLEEDVSRLIDLALAGLEERD